MSKAYYDSRVDPAQQSYNVYFRLSDSVPLTYSTAEDVMNRFAVYEPLFQEALPLSLEEIFIYEMGGEDYAVRDIML